ncbi:MAG: YbaB/EbfC family nucleoid-associated protein [Acidobacteriota bacterium]
MKLPGGFDPKQLKQMLGGFDPRQMQQMMKDMQSQQEEMQRKLGEIRVDAAAGGGMVSVVMSGTKEMISIKIEPDAVKEGDIDMLQDLIVAAVNEATRKADEKAQEAMRSQFGGLLGGLGLGF